MTTDDQPSETIYQPDVVIYHDKCMDGFTAAWAIWKRWRDAPEYVARNYGMGVDCPYSLASRAALDRMIRGRAVTCQPHGQDRYGRMLARCAVRGRDIGCAMVAAGQAVERYGRLNCAERGQ